MPFSAAIASALEYAMRRLEQRHFRREGNKRPSNGSKIHNHLNREWHVVKHARVA